MKDKCPTCGTECQIAGNGTTYHYEPPDWLKPYDELESQLKESESKLKIAREALESIATYKVTEATCSGVDKEAGVMNFTVGAEVELYDERAELARKVLEKLK